MKKAEVKIGKTYVAKISGRITEVRIERESPHGGWEATNLLTNRRVRIKSARKLRWEAAPGKPRRDARSAARAHTAATAPLPERNAAEDTPRAKGAPGDAKGKMSGLDAAAKVLAEAGTPMNTRDMWDAMEEKRYWHSDAPTPYNTLYSAILREIKVKGIDGGDDEGHEDSGSGADDDDHPDGDDHDPDDPPEDSDDKEKS